MNDIANRADIERLIDAFYTTVRADDLLGPIFNGAIGDNWSHHLPIMYQFWDMVLFSAPGYAGSPVRKHTDLDKRMPMDKPHFERWVAIWKTTVDGMFAGEIADMAKNKAELMANLIRMKIEMSREGFETLN
jgi:hemoglobin